jgi:hypothetical protein
MRMSGVTETQFRSIVTRVSESYAGNLIVHQDAHPNGQSGCTARVTVTDSYGAGTRVTWMGRHGPYACWHAYRDVLALLFTEHPTAIVRTGLEVYRGAAGFLADYPATGDKNIGSQMQPATMPEMCDCGYSDGPWVEALEAAGPHPVLPARTRRNPRQDRQFGSSVMDLIRQSGFEATYYPDYQVTTSRAIDPMSAQVIDNRPQGLPDTDALLAEISSLLDGDPWNPAHP